MTTNSILLFICCLVLLLPALLSRLWFLASTPMGFLFYYPNIINDFTKKRLSLPRRFIETFAFFLGTFGIAVFLATLWWVSLFPLALVTLLELTILYQERKTLNAVYLKLDSRRNLCKADQKYPKHIGAMPSPSVHPSLVYNLMGAFVSRFPDYSLGDLWVGREFKIVLIVANHTCLPCQVSIEISCDTADSLYVEPKKKQINPICSGCFRTISFDFQAKTTSGCGKIVFQLSHGDQLSALEVRYNSIFSDDLYLESAVVHRYPGGCRSAFAWRGDMDLYDENTGQSIFGLTNTLNLAARYCFPQTMYLSTRLSLNKKESTKFFEHFGVARGQNRIKDFMEWMQKKVELRHRITYPYEFKKPYAMELGNHMHLHYGTDAAASADNQWKLQAKIGEGNYPWHGTEKGSFEEQRDNALRARHDMEKTLGFSPKSWAMPDSTNDEYTPKAVEAAGCSVLSDSNSSHIHNVVFQPPPHHPEGTQTVELTKRYPGDPQDFIHLAMNYFWFHRGHRLRIPIVFMCHQHLHIYEGYACTRFTEAVMNYVLTRFHGDLHINTVFGIGSYWHDFFSPKTRKVNLRVSGNDVLIENKGPRNWANVPIELNFANGKKSTILVDLSANQSSQISYNGIVQPDIDFDE